jgi:hypothetical protein
MKSENQEISFITLFPQMVDAFPEPEPSSKNTPEWFRKIPGFYDNDQSPSSGVQKLTVKKCMAFLDILTSGYILKAPFDIYIDTTEGKQVFDVPQSMKQFVSTPMTGMHDMRQISGYPINKDQYIDHIFRVNLVWLVKTSPGYSSIFINPQHREDSPLFAISAVIDTDSFASDGLFSFLVKNNFKGFIKQGTPLVQVIPFKRTNFVSKIVRSMDEVKKINKQRNIIRSVFNSGYKKQFWKKKVYK